MIQKLVQVKDVGVFHVGRNYFQEESKDLDLLLDQAKESMGISYSLVQERRGVTPF